MVKILVRWANGAFRVKRIQVGYDTYFILHDVIEFVCTSRGSMRDLKELLI